MTIEQIPGSRLSRRTILTGAGLAATAAVAPAVLRPSEASAQTTAAPTLTAVSGELVRFRAALANRFFSRCNVAVLGDSISEGQGATQVAYRSVNRLADALRLRFPVDGVAGGQGFLPPQFISPTLPPPAAVSGSPALNTSFGPGWRSYSMTGSQSYTYTVNGTSVDVMYPKGSGAGTMGVQVDGGPVNSVNTFSTTLSDGSTTHFDLGGPGSHTVTITAMSGTVWLDGIIVYNGDESSGITVHDCSHFGSTLHAWASAPAAGTRGWLNALSPSLVVFELGVNDYDGQESITTFQSDLATMAGVINGVAGSPSVLVLVDYDPYNLTRVPWSSYVSAYQTWAATNGYALLDLTQRMPATGASQTYGLYYSDNRHPSNEGHSFIADAIAMALTSN